MAEMVGLENETGWENGFGHGDPTPTTRCSFGSFSCCPDGENVFGKYLGRNRPTVRDSRWWIFVTTPESSYLKKFCVSDTKFVLPRPAVSASYLKCCAFADLKNLLSTKLDHDRLSGRDLLTRVARLSRTASEKSRLGNCERDSGLTLSPTRNALPLNVNSRGRDSRKRGVDPGLWRNYQPRRNQFGKMCDTEDNYTVVSGNVSLFNQTGYCNLTNFSMVYKEMHGYTSLFVCVLGMVANLLNVVVLTRKEMRTPTNMILTGLAIADLLVMVDYMPFSYYMYIKKSKYTYSIAVFTLFHANFSQVCHTISIWLTVIIAIWRCIAIAYPQMNRVWCQMKNTVIVIVGTYIACPVACIPQYFTYKLKCRTIRNETLYTVYSDGSILLRDIHYWIYGFLMKLLPCVLLTILSLRLIMALIQTKKRQKNLIQKNSGSESGKKSKKQASKEKKADRTTKMLLVVLLLFLITEFPQGILGLMNYSLGDVFLRNCYLPLGDLLDILALFNSGINFMIYCAMSRQFRVTFQTLFTPRILNKCMPSGQHNNVETCMTQVTHV